MEIIKIESKQDGLQLEGMVCNAVGQVRGIVQISHGMAEHKERYIPFMGFLSQHGYVSIIHDHRGHGKSVRSNEDLGYFYDTEGKMIMEDLHQVTLLAKEKWPNVPLILFGHSMGSMVVRKFLKKYDFLIDQLIVCGSPSKNRFAKVGLAFTKFIGLFHGQHFRSKFLQHLTFGRFDQKIGEKGGTDAWICSDPEVVSDYHNDPLCGFVFTLNGFQNLFHLMIDIYQTADDWSKQNLQLPILFLAGSKDPVIINKRKWIQSQTFLKKLGYMQIQNIFYQGLHHELLNESIAPTIYEDILKWIRGNSKS